ncbi:MAG: HD domain-containing protein, partial [Prolixibacteraceae bacterium]|nr:HD domain-containing protein [Prolixibacteraceae bacterium]
MSKINASVLQEAEKFVSSFLEQKLSEDIIFHTFEHARDIVKNAEFIGNHSGLNEDQMNMVKLSALFHDVGYVFQDIDHESKSAETAREFLSSKGIDEDQIKKVEGCILATKVPQNPQDEISKVLCDADLMHFATGEYFEKAEKLRKEWKRTGLYDFNKKDFNLNSIGFFKKHHYHTEYGKTVLEENKKKTLEQLNENIKMHKEKKNKKEGKKDKENKKLKGYSRGVESMFRLTARNQISL